MTPPRLFSPPVRPRGPHRPAAEKLLRLLGSELAPARVVEVLDKGRAVEVIAAWLAEELAKDRGGKRR